MTTPAVIAPETPFKPYQILQEGGALEPYPRQFYVDFPDAVYPKYGTRGLFLDIRACVQWLAYRAAAENYDYAYRTQAAVLRALADQFYPAMEDLLEFSYEHSSPGQARRYRANSRKATSTYRGEVDVDLLFLTDGYLTVNESALAAADKAEALMAGEDRYECVATVDFPKEAFEKYGVRGMRVPVRELITWVACNNDLGTEDDAPNPTSSKIFREIADTYYADRNEEIAAEAAQNEKFELMRLAWVQAKATRRAGLEDDGQPEFGQDEEEAILAELDALSVITPGRTRQ